MIKVYALPLGGGAHHVQQVNLRCLGECGRINDVGLVSVADVGSSYLCDDPRCPWEIDLSEAIDHTPAGVGIHIRTLSILGRDQPEPHNPTPGSLSSRRSIPWQEDEMYRYGPHLLTYTVRGGEVHRINMPGCRQITVEQLRRMAMMSGWRMIPPRKLHEAW